MSTTSTPARQALRFDRAPQATAILILLAFPPAFGLPRLCGQTGTGPAAGDSAQSGTDPARPDPARANTRQLPTIVRQDPVGPMPIAKPVVFDRLIGFVGDRPILESMVRQRIKNNVLQDAARTAPLTRGEIRGMRRQYIGSLIRSEFLAQSTLTLDGDTRERLEQFTEMRLEERRREDIDAAGSVSKYADRIQRLNMDSNTIERERELELRAQVAQSFALQRRKQTIEALVVTPNQMRAFYREHPEVFGERTDVEIVSVPDPETAKRAADLWREKAETARLERELEVKVRYERGVRATKDDPRIDLIKEFADEPVGTVSLPTARDGVWWVMRVAKREDRKFEDPTVQAAIRRELAQRSRAQFTSQLIDKARAGISWWIDDSGDR